MSNDDLEARLRSLIAAIDPVPQTALQAAYSALDWRNLDSELAQLTADTGTGRDLAHVRGLPPRLLTFRNNDVTIDLEVSAQDDAVRLLGQLDPAAAATVTAQTATGSVSTQADARGRFSMTAAAGARMRVIVELPGEGSRRATTEWFLA